MKKIKNIRRSIFFAKINEKLDEYKDLIDLLTLLGVRSPIFSIIGLSSQFIHIISQFLAKDYKYITNECEAIPTSEFVDKYILSKLKEYKKFEYENLSFYQIDDNILIYEDGFFCYPSFSENFKQKLLSLILPKFSSFEIIYKNSKLEFIELTNTPFYSLRGETLWKRIKKFLDSGNNRSILLNGFPGSGKSELAFYVANKIREYYNAKILRVVASTVDLSHNDLKLILDFFKIDVVILDEIDKMDNINSILHLLETNKYRHKLFIATSNNGLNLSEAARRCGRFDEIYHINDLPPEILENNFPILNKELNDEQKQLCMKLQVSSVNDLQIRLTSLKEDFNFEKEYQEILDHFDRDKFQCTYDDNHDDYDEYEDEQI